MGSESIDRLYSRKMNFLKKTFYKFGALKTFFDSFSWLGDASFVLLFLGVTFFYFLIDLSRQLFWPIDQTATVISYLLLLFLGAYVVYFYILSKALEKKGFRLKISGIGWTSFSAWLALLFTEFFTALFNWASPGIFWIQIAIVLMLALTLTITLSIGSPASAVLFILISIIGAGVIAYNYVRLYVLIPVRLVESNSAREAVRKALPKTSGRIEGILSLFFVLFIFALIMLFIFSVIDLVTFSLSVSLGQIGTTINLVLSNVLTVFWLFTSVFVLVEYYADLKIKRQVRLRRR